MLQYPVFNVEISTTVGSGGFVPRVNVACSPFTCCVSKHLRLTSACGWTIIHKVLKVFIGQQMLILARWCICIWHQWHIQCHPVYSEHLTHSPDKLLSWAAELFVYILRAESSSSIVNAYKQQYHFWSVCRWWRSMSFVGSLRFWLYYYWAFEMLMQPLLWSFASRLSNLSAALFITVCLHIYGGLCSKQIQMLHVFFF